MTKRIGLYPGSFDPLTKGHVDIIRRGLGLVDRLIVAIGVSAGKQPLFSFEARQDMIKHELDSVAQERGVVLEVCSFDGLLVDLARDKGAGIIIRGLRNAQDFDYEAQMTAMNRAMNDAVETVYLQSAAECAHISSTLVRQIARMGGDVRGFVPAYVAEILAEVKW